jgi:hypothetical protein
VYAEAVKIPVDTAHDTKTVTVSISAKNLPIDFFICISPLKPKKQNAQKILIFSDFYN